MFTWRHFVWLAICAVLITLSIMRFRKSNMTLQQLLNYCCAVCVGSELIKVFSTIRLVPSTNGVIMHPYLPMNHLPLHLCSLQIILIFYIRFTSNRNMRESIMAFMYPTCIVGAIMALAMPSIFTTTVPVEKAFVHPQAYQFFIFHSMLVVLGVCLSLSDEIKWEKKHLYATWVIMLLLGFISLYVNSMFASPHYVDGELVSVDFWPNFFFTYDTPIGIKLTQIWHWWLYLVVIVALMIGLSTLFFLPLLRKKQK